MNYLPKIAPLILKLLFLSPYVAKDIGVMTENSHRVGGIISETKKKHHDHTHNNLKYQFIRLKK